LVAKRLELLRELVPGAIRIAVLVDRTNATTTESILRDVEAVARVMGLQIQVLNASTRREIDATFATDRKVDVERLFTHRWRLEQAEEAYRLFDTQTTGKAVILPS
jgi:threonine dehydrogenase-like Zn-dependent dehydrogenase